MAEGKYGRLFTEADLALAAIYAATRALGLPIERSPDGKLLAVVSEADEAARDALTALKAETLTFPADEPLFLLRGQDAYAPSAVSDYLHSLNTALEHRLAVERAADRMIEWQVANPDRVKVPD